MITSLVGTSRDEATLLRRLDQTSVLLVLPLLLLWLLLAPLAEEPGLAAAAVAVADDWGPVADAVVVAAIQKGQRDVKKAGFFCLSRSAAEKKKREKRTEFPGTRFLTDGDGWMDGIEEKKRRETRRCRGWEDGWVIEREGEREKKDRVEESNVLCLFFFFFF